MLRVQCWLPVPETGKWKPRPVLLLDVVLLVFQVHVVARKQQGHAHAMLAQRVDAAVPTSTVLLVHNVPKYIRWV
jgi:hypothetical protein